VQGQNGSTACFNAACVLVRGFDLPPTTAFEILRDEYNPRCAPPWSNEELAHKVASATQSTRPRGYLLRGQYTQVLKIGDHVELAHRYIATLGEHAVYTQGSTYLYDDGVWRPLDEDTQLASVMKFSGAPVSGREGSTPLYLTRNACEGIVRLSQAQVADRTFFDSARRGLAFQNGLLAVVDNTAAGVPAKEVALLPHSPDNRARFAYPFPYEDAPCPRWAEFLDSVWAGDPDMFVKQAVLRQWLGASLFGLAPRYKKVILLAGDTNSGKSTLIKVVRALFPTGTVRTVPFHEWQEDYKRAKLADALLNTAAEVPSADLMKSEAFKAIVAGDSVGARNPFKEAFDFIPICGHLFAANTLPRVHDRSDAVFDRIVVLSFNRRFFRNPALGQEQAVDGLDESIIASEKPGIIAWAVRGLEKLLQSAGRYVIPPSSDQIVDSWKRDSDQLLVFFDEEFLVERGKRVRTEAAWGRYVAWADRSKHKVMTKTNFRREFETIIARKTGTEQPAGKSNGHKVFRDVMFAAGHDDQTFTGEDIREDDEVGLRIVDNSKMFN
jgi:putative DNA primase/helicase